MNLSQEARAGLNEDRRKDYKIMREGMDTATETAFLEKKRRKFKEYTKALKKKQSL